MSSEPGNPLSQLIPLQGLDILAVDPGDTSGWVRLNTLDRSFRIGMWHGELEPGKEVNKQPPNIIVCENYLIRPPHMTRGKQWTHNWNKGSTMRIIGSLQTVAGLHDCQFELQEPSIKPVGYGWAGLNYVKGKQGTHIQDAAAHLAFFLHKKLKVGIDTIRSLIQMQISDK